MSHVTEEEAESQQGAVAGPGFPSKGGVLLGRWLTPCAPTLSCLPGETRHLVAKSQGKSPVYPEQQGKLPRRPGPQRH